MNKQNLMNLDLLALVTTEAVIDKLPNNVVLLHCLIDAFTL